MDKEDKPQRYFKVCFTFPEHPGDIFTLTVPAASEDEAVETVKAGYLVKKMYPKFLTVKGVG